MLGHRTFCVPADTLREQVEACDILLAGLDGDRDATLEFLFRSLRESGYCLDCGPEVIIRLGIKPNGDPPVPVLDLRTPETQGWAGIHCPLLARRGQNRYRGHFITRNLASPGTDGFTEEEWLDCVERHETFHVLQSMSGLDSYLMTAEEMTMCKGYVGALPGLASHGKLSRDHAFDLAGRWFLRDLMSEVEA